MANGDDELIPPASGRQYKGKPTASGQQLLGQISPAYGLETMDEHDQGYVGSLAGPPVVPRQLGEGRVHRLGQGRLGYAYGSELAPSQKAVLIDQARQAMRELTETATTFHDPAQRFDINALNNYLNSSDAAMKQLELAGQIKMTPDGMGGYGVDITDMSAKDAANFQQFLGQHSEFSDLMQQLRGGGANGTNQP